MDMAKFVQEVTIKDPETLGDVGVAIYKHPNGGMFGIDCSFLDQCTDEDIYHYPVILDPFVTEINKNNLKYVMLCD